MVVQDGLVFRPGPREARELQILQARMAKLAKLAKFPVASTEAGARSLLHSHTHQTTASLFDIQ